jgi:hypothetical protein
MFNSFFVYYYYNELFPIATPNFQAACVFLTIQRIQLMGLSARKVKAVISANIYLSVFLGLYALLQVVISTLFMLNIFNPANAIVNPTLYGNIGQSTRIMGIIDKIFDLMVLFVFARELRTHLISAKELAKSSSVTTTAGYAIVWIALLIFYIVCTFSSDFVFEQSGNFFEMAIDAIRGAIFMLDQWDLRQELRKSYNNTATVVTADTKSKVTRSSHPSEV